MKCSWNVCIVYELMNNRLNNPAITQLLMLPLKHISPATQVQHSTLIIDLYHQRSAIANQYRTFPFNRWFIRSINNLYLLPSFKSAAAGLPICVADCSKSIMSSTNWKASPRWRPYSEARSCTSTSHSEVEERVRERERERKIKKQVINCNNSHNHPTQYQWIQNLPYSLGWMLNQKPPYPPEWPHSCSCSRRDWPSSCTSWPCSPPDALRQRRRPLSSPSSAWTRPECGNDVQFRIQWYRYNIQWHEIGQNPNQDLNTAVIH